MSDRYKVVEDSILGHCCIIASVIDTTETDEWAPPICECVNMDDAIAIATALNNRAES